MSARRWRSIAAVLGALAVVAAGLWAVALPDDDPDEQSSAQQRAAAMRDASAAAAAGRTRVRQSPATSPRDPDGAPVPGGGAESSDSTDVRLADGEFSLPAPPAWDESECWAERWTERPAQSGVAQPHEAPLAPSELELALRGPLPIDDFPLDGLTLFGGKLDEAWVGEVRAAMRRDVARVHAAAEARGVRLTAFEREELAGPIVERYRAAVGDVARARAGASKLIAARLGDARPLRELRAHSPEKRWLSTALAYSSPSPLFDAFSDRFSEAQLTFFSAQDLGLLRALRDDAISALAAARVRACDPGGREALAHLAVRFGDLLTLRGGATPDKPAGER